MTKAGDTEPRMSPFTEMSHEAVELVRAERGSDLWSVIEAAQSSRLLTRDELEGPAEEQAVTALDDALERAIEVWEDDAMQNKAPVLRLLDDRLADLAPHGLSVYWGCIERRLALSDGAEVPMRVAVISLGRSAAPTRDVVIPVILDATDVDLEDDDDDDDDDDGGGFAERRGD